MRVWCVLGLHGPRWMRPFPARGSRLTCEHCGAEWRAVYDGQAPYWRRVA